MATRSRRNLETLSPDTVSTFCHFQFSGSGTGSSTPMPNFSGSGFMGCYLSGTTYTLVANSAWPQLIGIHAQLALSPSYFGTVSGAMDVVFNGSQVNQFAQYFSGSKGQGTGSGANQSIDFNVCLGNGAAVSVPYQSGSNWAYFQITYLNNDYTRG